MKLKILNLYAGIGGNRKLWDGDIDRTQLLRNCVNPLLAHHIFKRAFKERQEVLM